MQVPGITPIPILRSTPTVGGSITLVGFGAGGTDSGSTGGAGIKRAGTASLDNLSSTLVHLYFTVPGEANIAPGDSGGPGLVTVGNTHYVAGVHSCHTQANSALGDHAFDTRVDAYASWIDSVIPAGAAISVLGGGITIADGNVAYKIVTAPATSSDPSYSGLNAEDVSVMNIDNDVAAIRVVPIAGLVTTESGGTAFFTVRLDSEPAAEVTVGLAAADMTEGTPSAASLTFTAGNWNVFQTVTVTGVDDSVADGNVTYTIVTEPAAGGDASYSGLDPDDVWITNNDNDPGILVNPASGLVTTESGGTATFTVRLSTPPAAGVTIGLSSSDPTEGTAWPASLTFTPVNWSAAQTVTVAGLDDSLVDGDVAFAVVLTPASSDPLYGGLGPSKASVTNLDNEVPARRDSPGLYDPASSWWYLRNSLTTGVDDVRLGYGPPGDGWTPIVGDWDGDGATTVGLYDPKTGYFYLQNSNTTGIGEIAFFYGEINSGWLPVAGDWDGNHTETIGLYDPRSGLFYLRNSHSTGMADVVFGFGPGESGWQPIAGDWDGPAAEPQAADARAVDQIDLRSVVARELGGDLNRTLDGLLRPAIGPAEIDAVFGGQVQ